jgi:pimeloyl-ACP methyl ester carboxylesterase
MSAAAKAAWRSPDLGRRRDLDLPQGRIAVFESGTGPAIVFVHGLLVNANLWRKPIARLSGEFHCVALDLPLGSHLVPIGEAADPTPTGLADLIADAIEALGLDDVTIVGNDTGGALCQILVTRRPERVGRLVLTPCDYRDDFPPKMFAYFKPAARIPGALRLLLAPMRLRAPRHLPFAFGWLVKRKIDRQAEDSYVYPAMVTPGVLGEVRRILQAVDTRYTNEAADRLGSFTKPALIAWAREDRLFKPANGEALARDLGNARLEWIDDSRTFVAEDNPDRLAELIAGFARRPQAAGPPAAAPPA